MNQPAVPADRQRGFTVSPWSAGGKATLEAAGNDPRTALEAGLRAMLAVVLARPPAPSSESRSAPVHGEGADLAGLFADLADDLLEQLAFFGAGLTDVALDGVLRRDDGGYVAWGYASGTLTAASVGEVPQLVGTPTVSEDAARGIVLRATLRRP